MAINITTNNTQVSWPPMAVILLSVAHDWFDCPRVFSFHEMSIFPTIFNKHAQFTTVKYLRGTSCE